MRSEPTRIAMIGLGSIAAKVYLPELTQRPDVEVIALGSRRAETVGRVGDLYRIDRRFTSVDELLATKPDVVFVHASTAAHFEIIERCLNAGVHVFVDKPLTDDLAQSLRLVKLAESRGLLLAVGFNRRFAPLIVRASASVAQPTMLSMEKHRPAVDGLPARHTLFDGVIHLIDTLVSIAGDGVEVVEYKQLNAVDGSLALASGTLATNSCVAQFSMYREAGSDYERLAIHGKQVSAEVVNLDQLSVSRFDPDQKRSITSVEGFGSWDTTQRRRGFTAMIDHVLGCLDHPDSCTINAAAVMRSHEIIESLASGDW